MSPRIRILDPLIANQIAAGEVVERPSSVVKELVENALDAGATSVQIELDDGGRGRIEIVDDGGGIEPDDAPLIFARHATSKLQSAHELAAIASYGFRGEALASIASVARVTLHSRRREAELGVEVRIEGSVAPAVRPIHCGVGTRIVVRDLFFNTPARAAFLRGAATELGHVIRLVEALALARPSLAIQLRANNRRVAAYPARATLRERALDVFGPEVAADLYPIELDGSYRLRGLLSSPGVHRGTPASLFLVVDGRPVRDRTLGHSVVAAYGDTLERGRHPVGVLHLDVPPGAVDVNVHPTKAEVRFASSRAVHAAIGEAVRTMLEDAPWAKASASAGPAQLALGVVSTVPRPAVASSSPPPLRLQPAPLRAPPPVASALPPLPRMAGVPSARPRLHPSPPSALAGADAFVGPADRADAGLHDPAAAAAAGATASGEATTGSHTARRVLGAVAERWIALSGPDGLCLLDAHGAHERLLRGRLLAGRAAGTLAGHRLLIPRIVPLPIDHIEALLAAAALWSPFGLEFAPAGEQALLLRAHPVDVPLGRVEAAVVALAAALADRRAAIDAVDPVSEATWVAELLACYGAVQPGEEIGPAFVDALLAGTSGVDLRQPGPHGIPARLDLPVEALERLFRAGASGGVAGGVAAPEPP